MNEILELSKELKEELDNLPLFKEYKRVEALYLSNNDIIELKKQIVRAKNENRLDDHEKLLKEYNSHPLVENYFSLKEEVMEYLKEVSKVIQEK